MDSNIHYEQGIAMDEAVHYQFFLEGHESMVVYLRYSFLDHL